MSHRSAVWLKPVLDRAQVASTVLQAITELHNIEFDTIAFRGVSGALLAPILAYKMEKELCIIRKPDMTTHSTEKNFEGFVESKAYIIVDDLVASGDTVMQIIKQMYDHNPKSKFKGLYLYTSYSFMLRQGFNPALELPQHWLVR